MLAPKIHKKTEKMRFLRVWKMCPFFKVIVVRFWWSLGGQLDSKLTPRTAQDGAQERQRAAQDGPRGGPESLEKRTEHPTRFGHPRMTPKTPRNVPIFMNF